MKKKENFPQNKLVDFFRGGRIQGDVCVGDCWEIKDQIGDKKFSGGPEIFGGGTFWGNAKKGWKNFLVVPKSGGIFFGGHNNFWGRIFREKKKIPGGILWKNFKF